MRSVLVRTLPIAALACVLAAVVLSLGRAGQPDARVGEATEPRAQSSPVVAAVVDTSETTRPVFPYSVVPGGAFSPDELVAAARRDPVVAEHYRGIELEALRVERVREESVAHVSYRVGDQVFWTRNAVALRPGELVLTDGVNQIRARCGNRIAAAPLGPTQAEDPDLEWEGAVFASAGAASGSGAWNAQPIQSIDAGAPSLMADNSGAPYAGVPGTGSYAAPSGAAAAGAGGPGSGGAMTGGQGGASPSGVRPGLSVDDLLPSSPGLTPASSPLTQPPSPPGGPGNSGPSGAGGPSGPSGSPPGEGSGPSGGPGGEGGGEPGNEEGGQGPGGPDAGAPVVLLSDEGSRTPALDEGDGEASIPEPGTVWLLGAGLTALACRRVRARQASRQG